MFRDKRYYLSLAALAIVAVMSSAATSHPLNTADEPAEDQLTCQFIIRASNSYSFDVFVDFYYSTIINHAAVGVFKSTNLKYNGSRIQNRRIPRGQSMEQRVLASGRCSARRTWYLRYRIGSRSTRQTTSRSTKGNDQRTINMGRSSTW